MKTQVERGGMRTTIQFRKSSRWVAWFAVSLLVVLLSACASPVSSGPATSASAPKQAQTKFGRYGARNDPGFRENAVPAYFPNSAIPPKYPEPKPQTHGLDLSKHDWQTAKAYFQWLCENEAGEFIYKTVEDVDSVFEMRPLPPTDRLGGPRYDRYYLEDPWNEMPRPQSGTFYSTSNPYFFVMPHNYRISHKDPGQWNQKGDYFHYTPEYGYPVFERISTPLDRKRYGDAPFTRFTRVWPTHPEYDRDEKGNIRMFQLREHLNGPSPERRKELSLDHLDFSSPDRKRYDEGMLASGHIIPKVEAVHEIKSRYGYMWRGIEHSPHDRELGIAGGEVLIFDLKTNEVLGVRRNFLLAGTYAGSRDVDWLTAQECTKFGFSLLEKKVLKSVDPYKNLNIK
ncbi:MAG: hypothetical protein LBE81_02990 [Azonexus sp.]|uniref:hypothetical protein n=1 Tax=Azonexus sp. TaxID=1872668 RepID=UPI00282CBC90|nr:hypothetical protein [Azonexus sp.]MDR0775587.1 hypothetical protein [Azonexus sp.]